MTPEARQAATSELLSNTFQSFFFASLNPDTQADLEKTATLSAPDEAARLRAMVAFIGILRPSMETDATPEQLAAIGAHVLVSIGEIEKLAQTAQPPSARIWALLGLVRMAAASLRDDDEAPEAVALLKSAEDASRRALALDEKQDIAWDALMISVAKSDDRLGEMQQLATRRLALEPTPDNQFILVRTLARQGKDQEALEQVETALKAAPDNWSLRLMRATLLLRQPDQKSLEIAVPLMAELSRASEASGKDAGLYSALAGVMLARLHRFQEAELMLSADDPNGKTGKLAPPYVGFIADLQGFAITLAKAKRHEDVLATARVFANFSVKSADTFYLNDLGLSAAELRDLTQ